MVDRYWRKIENVENDIKNAMQISSILLKLKGYDNKLSNLEKIDDNTNDITSNSGLISTNTRNISSNSGLISTNTEAISTNSGQINTNKNNISTNSGKIITNKSAISINSGQINTNKNNISTNLGKINTNENNISSNLSKINNIKEFLISPKDFKKTFNIEKQIFKFNRNTHFYTIFEKEIIHDFTKNSLLFIDNNIHYKYENLSNDYYRLQHQYDIYDNEGNLIYRNLFNKDTYYDENKNPILLTIDDFCIYFKKNYDKIKVILLLHRHNRHGLGNIDLEIDDDNDNYININYIEKNNEDIEKNKNDISTNLIRINSYEDDIAYNLSEINYLKKNKSTQYLKNIKNILFYDKRDQISFKDIFFNKTFELNIKKNDFIEFNLRMLLDYENIKEAHIVITEFKLYNDNNEQIYFSTYNNSDSISYKNFVFINKHIFYNFEKDTKNLEIIIEFRMTRVEVVKIWYEPKNLDRFIIKHYGN